jgi:tetratricopeptide (TPR) repeat protein
MLSSFAFIAQFNSNVYEFKNTLLWKFVYERAKQGSDFCVLNEKIYDIIGSFTLSSNALKALIAQSLNQKLLALNIWTENIKLCAYLGDEHLWTLSQKQCLKIAQEINPENNNVIINNIQERLGKLLYISKPSEAIEYLGSAINNAIKIGNSPKVIELSGYLSKSCSLTGNYNGVIEAIDTILKYMNKENRLYLALIKHKKLKAMLAIGNAEEIHNLAANEIIPVVEQVLSGVASNENIPMDLIFETWLECNLTVAMALISQGNKKAFEILSVIEEIIEKNNVQNRNYKYRVILANAMAYSMQGEIRKSEDILIEFSQRTANEVVDSEIISLWNFINILNKLFKRDFKNIKQDMYSVVTFANNYNDVLIKNLLKVFLGKILQEEDNLARALDIFNEQVTIFAREKIAIGAMLCWYFIAKITLVTEGTDKALDICQKALDVAKNPKVSNYYFMVLYKRLIAEIFIIKGDMDAAKMYIEKALMIAKQYDIKLLKVTLFQLYAKYLEEMVSKKTQNRVNYAQNAINTYKKVLTLANDLGLPEIVNDIQKNYASFKAFCQLNSIPV